MMNEWIWLFVGLAASSGIFALLVVLYPKLKGETQGYPLEAIIEPLLLPMIYEAICAAYRMSEQAMDDIGDRIQGLDKKAIADSVYAMLPDEIAGYDLTVIKLKRWMTQIRVLSQSNIIPSHSTFLIKNSFLNLKHVIL